MKYWLGENKKGKQEETARRLYILSSYCGPGERVGKSLLYSALVYLESRLAILFPHVTFQALGNCYDRIPQHYPEKGLRYGVA